MNIINILKNSFQLPHKQALFRLNRMNMRDTLVYINLLFFILFLPDAVNFVLNIIDANGSIPDVVYIQVIFLYPALTIFITTISVTGLSGIAYLMRTWLSRKLAFHQLWKMTAFALTVPIIVYLMFKLINQDSLILVSLAIWLWFIYKMITVYPKKAQPQ
ncbi:DUF1189 family protein [Aquisalibacillus elongatus]|uniref:Uncharacterized protein DUF1189 n=1 Tax=Aquisalibacillus elongatus TaxID=485577 RepID=A0A3N5C065_9BACI|nr:DUF1189 family protein [Aquisalibacillus elongatus]RPF55448.1 uncharacterized protein DUF1189 [Aquisalibacillus elongatus]